MSHFVELTLSMPRRGEVQGQAEAQPHLGRAPALRPHGLEGHGVWRVCGERAEPKEALEEIDVGLEHLDPQCLHIQRWGKGSDVIGGKLRFRKGDIIFGKRRAYQRKLAVAEFGGICSAHAMVIRARPDKVLPEFLPFLMMSDRFVNRAVEISVGSLSPTISWTTLKLEKFGLPPLDKQRKKAKSRISSLTTL